jgi:hypothetical protein
MIVIELAKHAEVKITFLPYLSIAHEDVWGR